MMVSVGIDVSKDKHDCFIVNSEGEVLADVFTIPNNMDGFHLPSQPLRKIKRWRRSVFRIRMATM